MMNERKLREFLSDLPLGGIRFFDSISSTNDAALAWAEENAPDLGLVCADEQTCGRGRGDHSWFTPPGAALAFSLILRPRENDEPLLSLFSGLGALAVCEALSLYGRLHAEIKWPNDVLLDGCKVGGVLAEAVWFGDRLECVVLGIGVNVTPAAVPLPERVSYPATCIETVVNRTVDRLVVLHDILQSMLYWRGLAAKEVFLHAWQTRLAFRGQLVEVRRGLESMVVGRVDGLEQDGSLRLVMEPGRAFTVHFGEVHLRPVV